jgi:hypothetical protein
VTYSSDVWKQTYWRTSVYGNSEVSVCIYRHVQSNRLIYGISHNKGNNSADDLGLLHLFNALSLSGEDDFFFEGDEGETTGVKLKDIRRVNILKDHLAPKKRKRRKDCPNYVDVVRSYGHATFRPDTFPKSKKMIKNEDGSFEFHLPHIQNMSIQLSHASFLISELYYEWQQLNRWVYTSSDGEEIEVLPSICLRLFYYA